MTFFHLGQFFQKRVGINLVENGTAREIVYQQSLFDMPADSPAHQMPEGAGFAGFRFQERRTGSLDWRNNDWVAFLGASYFRSIGELFQYGLSARGIAINPANPNPPFDEEFPDFKEFWLEAVPGSDDQVRVFALLDGPSVSGAYAFLMTRGKAVVMDIDARIFTRKDVVRFGLAPLTSMYWYSETVKATAVDWRPEIHDFGRLWRCGQAEASIFGGRSTMCRRRSCPPSPTRTRAASGCCSAIATSTIFSTA